MTLIISAFAAKKMYQVTNTRLTKNGDLYDDYSIKTTLLECKNAVISISYTGIAYLGNLRTDEWLVKILSDFKAWGKGLKEVAEHIRNVANIEFRKINYKMKYHTFVIAGWFVGKRKIAEPTYGVITNCKDDNFSISDAPLDHFEIRTRVLKEGAKLNRNRGLGLSIEGMDLVIKERYFRKQLEKFISNKLNDNTDHNEVIKDLVRFIRMAASHKEYGKYINRYCVSIYLEVGSKRVITSYHNLDNKKISFTPNIITKSGLTFTGIEHYFGK